MSSLQSKPSSQTPRGSSGGQVTLGRSRARRDQLIGFGVTAFCLISVFFLQPFVTRMRQGTTDSQGKTTSAGIVPPPPEAIKQLAADFPRLTLSGFRGILTPVLWQQAEDNKNDRKWQDLNTTYNIIVKIQPYFRGPYTINAWNLAYNLSAQWHGIDEKYQWVLEGLNYLYDGEEFLPKDPDVLYEIAQMYFMKIGNSYERIDYRKMWRDNIMHQYQLDDPAHNDPKMIEQHRRVRRFLLMPQFHITMLPDVNDPKKTGYGVRISNFYEKDGKDQPLDFRYGLSPFYFAYIEYKRCLASGEQTTTGQTIVQAYPAMSLRLWCRDDAYYAASRICEMFYMNEKDEPAPENIENFDARVLEIRDCYRNVDIVAPMGVQAFNDYIGSHRNQIDERSVTTTHTKHLMETAFVQKVADAEHEMFEGLVAWYLGNAAANQPRRMTDAARDHLTKALPMYDAAIQAIQVYMDTIYAIQPNGTAPSDRADFAKFQTALGVRKEGIRSMLGIGATDRPDFSFLKAETIER